MYNYFMNNKRDSGVLLPLFSLPGKYGIGTLGKSAYKFIDFLKECGFSYWELLPLNPINNDNSPYNTSDAFAYNYLYIDLEMLVDEKLLTSRDFQNVDFGNDATKINYSLLFKNRKDVLYKAFRRDDLDNKYFKECLDNNDLKDYVLYMCLKEKNNFKPWYNWKLEDRYYSEDLIDIVTKEFDKKYKFYIWIQAKFLQQWHKLHEYAKSNGIELIGEIPHFLGYDSTQMYIHPELFLVDKRNQITHVSGFPPDEFSKVGQKWGNPLYDWDYIKQDGYKWWNRRINSALKMFDYVKLNHFRAFYQTYAVPFRAINAKHGEYVFGPKKDFFLDKLDSNLIASDLGKYDEAITDFVNDLPYPVLRTTILGFTKNSISDNEKFLPTNLPSNSYSYIGNHDNNPLILTLYDMNKDEFNSFKKILEKECNKLNLDFNKNEKSIKYYAYKTIESLFASDANHITLQIQDVLLTRNVMRTNCPGTVNNNNWSYRILSTDLNKNIVSKFKEYNSKYNR